MAAVQRDVVAGRNRSALNRLRRLAAAHPGDSQVYALLTRLYREAGDLAEAGRWGFLSDEVTPAELAAFEQAHPRASVRLRLISSLIHAQKISPTARQRLWRLNVDATQAAGSARAARVEVARRGLFPRRGLHVPRPKGHILLLVALMLIGPPAAVGAMGLALALFGVRHWDEPLREITRAVAGLL
jgi:hypothetical protein